MKWIPSLLVLLLVVSGCQAQTPPETETATAETPEKVRFPEPCYAEGIEVLSDGMHYNLRDCNNDGKVDTAHYGVDRPGEQTPGETVLVDTTREAFRLNRAYAEQNVIDKTGEEICSNNPKNKTFVIVPDLDNRDEAVIYFCEEDVVSTVHRFTSREETDGKLYQKLFDDGMNLRSAKLR